jgi:hypothetical protein
MRPADFWEATLDECILTYKGKIDEWRFFRNGFYLVHRTFADKPADILKEMSLPFDNEIQQEESGEDLLAEYNRLKESGALD